MWGWYEKPTYHVLVSDDGQNMNGPYTSAEEAEHVRVTMAHPHQWRSVPLVGKRDALMKYGDTRRRISEIYDPTFGDDKRCQRPECGHAYERHFDWDMDYLPNCKYCNCPGFLA